MRRCAQIGEGERARESSEAHEGDVGTKLFKSNEDRQNEELQEQKQREAEWRDYFDTKTQGNPRQVVIIRYSGDYEYDDPAPVIKEMESRGYEAANVSIVAARFGVANIAILFNRESA